MIDKNELLHKHRLFRIPLATCEKDYVLGLILWGIYQHPTIKEDWVFKGGTCLKKCYFQTYRFSEDLDFTLKPYASIEPEVILTYLKDVFTTVWNHCGLKVDVSHINMMPFPDKEGLFIQIKVPFQGPLLSSGSLPKIKLDLSRQEILVSPTIQKPLLHNYSDHAALQTEIQCYSFIEIFAEKLRAFVERVRPRDLYDIVHLHQRFDSKDKETLLHVIEKKFTLKNLNFPSALHNLSLEKLEAIYVDWEIMLAHQIFPLDPFEAYKCNQEKLFEWLLA
ncbi:MAG: nucleotidyl transferase AbiEii/AbiGii toxin family protein [Proteobacteria bacterium]|nr:nucleotidyl transferase AbiEii/AbiGii toxin family protein [Pseudomonadota bacterium]